MVQAQYTDGVFVVNEAGMGTDRASVSFIKDGQVTNDIYSSANNNEELGDVLQNLAVYNDIALMTLNNSHKVVVVNNQTFEKTHTLTENLDLPRYIAIKENKAYITCWGDTPNTSSHISVLDLTNFTFDAPIELEEGAEKIFEKGGKLYILHPGAFGSNDKMTVYNIATQEKNVYTVGLHPKDLVFVGNSAYIAISGPFVGGNASLVKFNLETSELTHLYDFQPNVSFNHLEAINQTLYIALNQEVYTYDTTTEQLNSQVLLTADISTWGGAYGMNIVDQKIYLANAGSYVGSGEILEYSTSGVLENSYDVGDIPSQIVKSASSKASVKNPSTLQLSAYPNPVTERLFLTTELPTSYAVYDMLGKKLQSGTYSSQGIQVDHLANGTYLLQIQQEKGSQTIRFIKK